RARRAAPDRGTDCHGHRPARERGTSRGVPRTAAELLPGTARAAQGAGADHAARAAAPLAAVQTGPQGGRTCRGCRVVMLNLLRVVRAAAKAAADVCALVLVAPAAATAWAERKLSVHSESGFGMWAQLVALIPRPPGVGVRRAFSRLTLDACHRSLYIGFGTIFTHRHTRIAEGVFIGAYALVGCAALGRGALIGSRVSLLSGGNLHELRPDGTWSPTDP